VILPLTYGYVMTFEDIIPGVDGYMPLCI